MKVVVVASHPIQYMAPLYRRLAARGRVELKVLFLSRHGVEARLDGEFGKVFRWDLPLLDGYASEFVPNAGGERSPGGFFSLRNLRVLAALRRERPAVVVITGYQYAAYVFGALAAKALGAKVLLRGESNLLAERPAWKRAVKRALLTPFFALFDGFLAIGRANRAYYAHYGVPESKLGRAPYTVDNERFLGAAEAMRPGREAARQRLGIPAGRAVVGFSGKLIDKKRPLFLVEVLARMAPAADAHLLLVGDGPLRAAVERRAEELGVRGRVTVTGFLNQSEIAAAYAALDVFALPSAFEPWGLVVNEAMCFGLPVLASAQVGAAPDLIDGNGFVLPVDDLDAWAAALAPLLADPAARARLGERSRQIIAQHGLDATAAGYEEACARVAPG